MKKTVAILMAAIVLAAGLCSCSHTVRLKFNDNGEIVGKGGLSYNYAPIGYEPTYQGEKWAYLEDEIGHDLYTIGDEDPEKWLTEEYTGATTMIFYSSDIDLPALAEMKPVTAYLCEQDENVYSISTIGDGGDGETGRQAIDKAVELLETGEKCMWPRTNSTATYQLKMYSPDWPAFYYNLVYTVCPDGNYLYDRVTEKCVEIGDILTAYHSEANAESSAETKTV